MLVSDIPTCSAIFNKENNMTFKTIFARFGATACIATIGITGIGITAAQAEGDNERSDRVATQTPSQTFKDVKSSSKYQADIQWAAERGITTGFKDGTFRPNTPTKRDETIVFMYRMAGSPEVKLPKSSPFKDVKPNHKFYREIIWAHNEGVTLVKKGHNFKPSSMIRRDDLSAFMYRFSNADSPYSDQFKDVSSKTRFAKEISWLKTSGITTGYKAGSFEPTYAVNRDAMTTFLHRMEQNNLKVEVVKPESD